MSDLQQENERLLKEVDSLHRIMTDMQQDSSAYMRGVEDAKRLLLGNLVACLPIEHLNVITTSPEFSKAMDTPLMLDLTPTRLRLEVGDLRIESTSPHHANVFIGTYEVRATSTTVTIAVEELHKVQLEFIP